MEQALYAGVRVPALLSAVFLFSEDEQVVGVAGIVFVPEHGESARQYIGEETRSREAFAPYLPIVGVTVVLAALPVRFGRVCGARPFLCIQ